MSGYSDEALGARGNLDPGTILLPKPFTGTDLDRCLAAVLGDPAVPASAFRPREPRVPWPGGHPG